MSDRPIVQWTFLQYKKLKKGSAPIQSFLNSATQIGSKILIYGGCDYYGEAVNQLFLYDTVNYQWSKPADVADFQEDHPGGRYGHTASLIEMHPPKIMIYGGMVGGGTFEFEAPDGLDTTGPSEIERPFMSWRRKGKKKETIEETDDAVYFLTLNADNWLWSKPLINSPKEVKPLARAEHSACKFGTNEIAIFGGWTNRPTNDMWTFNFVNMEWKEVVTSGIQPRARYRHTCEILGVKMFILGGSDNNEDEAEKCRNLGIHELSLETMQWSHPEIKGSDPFPRSGHSSAVIGAQYIGIFGGKLNNQVLLECSGLYFRANCSSFFRFI